MKDITNEFGTIYLPVSAIVFYQTEKKSDGYVEFFDIDKNGNPINAHPLTVREAEQLVNALNIKEDETGFLKPEGLLKNNILSIDQYKGRAIWYTKAQTRAMLFKESLEIPNGIAHVPAMLWIADRKSLILFALKSDAKPKENTVLFNAPFFNVYADGAVCMGSVDIDIQKTASLEEFTDAWEDYFFNSYFSHLIEGHNPIDGNCVTLWKELVDSGKEFPTETLKKYSNKTLKDFI